MTEIYAGYHISSVWDLDKLEVNLSDANAWYIKWDCLFVQREKEGEWEEFEGHAEDQLDQCFKRPHSIHYDDIEVDNGQDVRKAA
jgi:hypothetical protein